MQGWPFMWPNLPDPRHEPWDPDKRCDVVMSFERLDALVRRHIVPNDGPWEAVLGQQAFQELRVWRAEIGTLSPFTWEACDRAFGSALTAALTRPLVLRTSTRREPAWWAIARNGLMFVLRSAETKGELLEVRSIFWPLVVTGPPRDDLWREAAWYWVLAMVPLNGSPCTLPDGVVRSYITPANWGFVRRDSDWEWTGTFPHWD